MMQTQRAINRHRQRDTNPETERGGGSHRDGERNRNIERHAYRGESDVEEQEEMGDVGLPNCLLLDANYCCDPE